MTIQELLIEDWKQRDRARLAGNISPKLRAEFEKVLKQIVRKKRYARNR